jgi:hypothetical protein
MVVANSALARVSQSYVQWPKPPTAWIETDVQPPPSKRGWSGAPFGYRGAAETGDPERNAASQDAGAAALDAQAVAARDSDAALADALEEP